MFGDKFGEDSGKSQVIARSGLGAFCRPSLARTPTRNCPWPADPRIQIETMETL